MPPPAARAARRDSGASSTNHTPSGKVVEHVGGDLQRQARLAEAADAGQRQQPRAAEQLLRPRRARARGRRTSVSCCGRLFGVASSERSAGKSRRKRRMHELEDALGARQVAQAHGAQVAQRGAGRQALADPASRPPATASTWPPCATLMMRAARLTARAEEVVVAALGRRRACRPQRTRNSTPSVAAGSASACCSAARRRAHRADRRTPRARHRRSS